MKILPLTTKQRLAFIKLEELLIAAYNGLEKISIDKPYMNDSKASNSQLKLYERLYGHAKAGKFDEEKCKAIIEKHESTNDKIALAEDMLNDCRAWIEQRIYDNKVDEAFELLERASDIELSLESITPDRMEIIRDIFRYEQ